MRRIFTQKHLWISETELDVRVIHNSLIDRSLRIEALVEILKTRSSLSKQPFTLGRNRSL